MFRSCRIISSDSLEVKNYITFNYLIFNFERAPDDDPTGSKHVESRCENIINVVMQRH
jgi:hypothetical protein